MDETGWYITWAGMTKPWLHVFAVPELLITRFAIRLSRGRDVALEILGDQYAGTIGIDGWAAYIKLPCRKGQCNGHFLRRCLELLEVQKRGAARFPHAVQRLVLDGIQAKALLPALPPADRAAVVEQFQGRDARPARRPPRGAGEPPLRPAPPATALRTAPTTTRSSPA